MIFWKKQILYSTDYNLHELPLLNISSLIKKQLLFSTLICAFTTHIHFIYMESINTIKYSCLFPQKWIVKIMYNCNIPRGCDNIQWNILIFKVFVWTRCFIHFCKISVKSLLFTLTFRKKIIEGISFMSMMINCRRPQINILEIVG